MNRSDPIQSQTRAIKKDKKRPSLTKNGQLLVENQIN